jgi:hypothetical protein
MFSIERRGDTYLVDRLFYPIGNALQWVATRLAAMHHGRLNAYVAYALGFFAHNACDVLAFIGRRPECN